MNDGSSPTKQNGLRNEWSLLIDSFIEENEAPKPAKVVSENFNSFCQERGVTAQDLEKYSRHLSERRKSINHQIEEIKNLIDEKYSTIENLVLVKSDTSSVLKEIESLQLQGENLSIEMIKIDKEVRSLRAVENLINSALI